MSRKNQKPQAIDDLDRDIDDMFGETLKDTSIQPMINSNSTPNIQIKGMNGPGGIMKSQSEKELQNKFYKGSDEQSMEGKTKDLNNSGAEMGSENFPKKTKSENDDLTKIEVIKLKIKTNIMQNVRKTKEAIVEGGIYARQLDFKQVKDKYNEADKFWNKSKSLLKQSGAILVNQEPEIVRTPYWGWFMSLVSLTIAICVIIYVVNTNLSLIGTEKTQEVSVLKKNELLYNISGGIYTLMPLHFFTTINRNQLIDRMECLVQGNKKQCNAYDFRKCETVGIKNPEYDECMVTAYGAAGYPLREFCDVHYNASSTAIWSKSEAKGNGYLDQKYLCLKNAGVPKGQTYCQDLQRINGAGEDSQMELYDCYISSGISNDTFAEDRCSYLHDKNSANSDIRQKYIGCMEQSGQTVGDNPKFVCNNKFPWQKDNAFIDKCNKNFITEYQDILMITDPNAVPEVTDAVPVDTDALPDVPDALPGVRRLQFDIPTSTFDSFSNFDESQITNDDDGKDSDSEAVPFDPFATNDFEAFEIDPSAFEIDPSAFEIDPSAFEIDPSAFEMDLDAFEMDLDAFEFDLSDFDIELDALMEFDPFDLSAFATDFNPMSSFESIYQTWASFGMFNYLVLGYNPTQKQQDDIEYLENALAEAMAAFELSLLELEEEIEEVVPEEPAAFDPFGDFIDSVVDVFNGTDDADGGGGIDDPFALLEVLVKPPNLADFFVPIDLTNDFDIGYKEPEISNWTKQSYGEPEPQSCYNYFQAGFDLGSCYRSDLTVYDYQTCNTRTWNEWYGKSILDGAPDTKPPASEYFKCYFAELPITKEAKYADEHREACKSLYTDQKERLECYEYMKIPYGFDDQKVICTNKYKYQSQVDKLFLCLEDYGMEKNIDYCNIHPDYNIIDFNLPDILHLNFMTLSKKPFFDCVSEVDEQRAETSDSRQCTADLYLFEKVEETFTADGLFNPADFGIPNMDFNMDLTDLTDLTDVDPAAAAAGEESTDDDAPTSTFPQPDYNKIADCLFFYKMPPSAVQEQICRWKHIPDNGAYETTGVGCQDKYNKKCFPKYYFQIFSNDQCNEMYLDDYQFITGGEDVFLEDFKVQCRKVVIDYTPFDACMKKVNSESTLTQMNEWKKSHLATQNIAYQPYKVIDEDTLADYCEVMFINGRNSPLYNDYVECKKYVDQGLGAQECIILPENRGYVEKKYLFPYYQKYICFTFKQTIIDDEAKKCIYNGNSFLYIGLDMEFVTINECLKKYETADGFKMALKTVGKTSIYERIEGIPEVFVDNSQQGGADEEEDSDFSLEDIIAGKDLPTTLTEDQILLFLCNDEVKRMSLNFTTTPFQKIENYKKKKYNAMNFAMACETFVQYNGTHNNTVIHFSFPASNQKMQLDDSLYDDSFNETYLTIKRTDSNQQFFNLTMDQDLNFMQVQNHYLYFYDSAKQVVLRNGEEFVSFQGHSNTTTIMETEASVIFDQVVKQVSVKAIPIKVIEIGKVIVRRILGIGIQYADVTAQKLEFEKVDDLVPVQLRQSVSRKVLKQQQNSLIVNLKVGFGEQTVEYKFFTFGDIIGKIGGLWATYKSLLAYVAVFAIVRYALDFASMAKRKDSQQIRLIEISLFMKHIDSIRESLEDLISNETGSVRLALKEDLWRINQALQLQTDLYVTTIEKHETLKEMIGKYYPQGISDLFCKDQCADEWELLEVYDIEKKHAYLSKKIKFGWGQMIDDMQFRMSIYGIYQMKDNSQFESIKIQQSKDLLNNANERIKKLEDKSR